MWWRIPVTLIHSRSKSRCFTMLRSGVPIYDVNGIPKQPYKMCLEPSGKAGRRDYGNPLLLAVARYLGREQSERSLRKQRGPHRVPDEKRKKKGKKTSGSITESAYSVTLSGVSFGPGASKV
jgi:hypothetical protein